MSNLTKQVQGGVEFFVSADGSEAGMSQQGLSVFCGVAMPTVANLLASFSGSVKLASETLEDARSKGLAVQSVPMQHGGKDMKFIPAELCEAITYYYAFEATKVSDDVKRQARYSYRKFASIGIKSWILQVTGFKSNDGQDIASMLQTIMTQMAEMKQLTAEYVAIRQQTKDQPGLDHIINSYANGNLLLDSDYFTIQTWVVAKGVEMTQGQMSKLGGLVARSYTVHRGTPPVKKDGLLFGNRHSGKVSVYKASDIPLIEAAYRLM